MEKVIHKTVITKHKEMIVINEFDMILDTNSMSSIPYAWPVIITVDTVSPMIREIRKNIMGIEEDTAARASGPKSLPTQKASIALYNDCSKSPAIMGQE